MAKEQKTMWKREKKIQQQPKCTAKVEVLLSEEEKTLSWNHMTLFYLYLLQCQCIGARLSASEFLQHRWRVNTEHEHV